LVPPKFLIQQEFNPEILNPNSFPEIIAETGNVVIPEKLITVFKKLTFRIHETYLQDRQ